MAQAFHRQFGNLVVLVLAVSLVVRQIAVHRAERHFPPPGQLVEFDGRLSHIQCTGSGSPTILLESGLDNRGSWGWYHLFDELVQVSRVCAYDRAGLSGASRGRVLGMLSGLPMSYMLCWRKHQNLRLL